MTVIINGTNTPTAGGVTYGNGTEYATTSAGTSGQVLISAGASAPTWGTPSAATTATNLAGGSAGTVPYQSASGTTAMLAAGSSGQVLTSSGAGAPSWTTPSSGALVYITTVTASSSSTVNIEDSFTAYNEYFIKVNLVPSVPNEYIRMRAKFAGSYDSSSNYGLSLYTQNDANPQYLGGNPATSLAICTPNLRANHPSSFEFRIHQPSVADTKSFDWMGFINNNGATASMLTVGTGCNTTTSQLQGVQFYVTNGVIASGTFRLYGIVNS